MQEKNILTERKSWRISVGNFLLDVNDLQVALAGGIADKSAIIHAVATEKLKEKEKQISPRRLRAKYTHRTKSYDFMLLRVCILYRPPKVRPKNLTIGGRYFYGKIQL